jgi:hypothetical protein
MHGRSPDGAARADTGRACALCVAGAGEAEAWLLLTNTAKNRSKLVDISFLVPGLPWISDYDHDHCSAFDSEIAMVTARRFEAAPR